ncbi:MAG: DUF99 family protein [Methanosarcinaceae archaeon]|nr:DUF99 family protein [Methanosarcinaceae archaeon]
MKLNFHIKPEIRILGVDDSALISDEIMIVGTVFRGGGWMDGVLRSEITRDGKDATEVICRMAKRSKHYGQLRVIMLDGVTYGGFNVVDISKLNKETGLPVIVVMRSYPDFEKIRGALGHFTDGEERLGVIEKAGRIEEVVTKKPENPIYIQKAGIGFDSAKKIVRLTATRSNIPEPLRVAHMIATGIVFGESRGKA